MMKTFPHILMTMEKEKDSTRATIVRRNKDGIEIEKELNQF